MSSYRFCRTDDIALLVDALNRCWLPYFPDAPAVTAATFKRSIRDLQVWCSSCMVAFSDSDPIGVLIGAKRPSGTLVHRIAVHPDHLRQGHGRHLLESLGSKLAILGPPRIVAEVPEGLAPACALFSASGYAQESLLTDYVLNCDEIDEQPAGSGPCPERVAQGGASRNGLVIPITVDDLAANGLLEDSHRQACWDRSVQSLGARKDHIEGLAVVDDERIDACILYVKRAETVAAIMSLRSFIEDGGARLKQLLSRLRARGTSTLEFPKVHPAELSKELLETLGFRAAARHRLYAATL